ncbi:MAG: FAD/NAD(P)-binding protein [Alphaproteobacteria bacterium]|nr:FAD/NAD(P)-binding protein [Alphaproteobacteria bacterium]
MPEQQLSAADLMMPIPFRVEENRIESSGCAILTIKPVAGEGLEDFKPGQFYMLYVFGHGEVPISINGNPAHQDSLVFTIKNVGSVTSALCAMEKGDVLGVRGPFGTAWPLEKLEGDNIIIMAGGLGCVPLRPVLHYLMDRKEKYGEVFLLYGMRTPEELLFADEMCIWNEHIQVKLTADSAGSDWQESVGLVTELVKPLDVHPEKTSALVCGPENMMRFSAEALVEKGLKSSQIYVSMERNMKCGIGRCGRCQYGPHFVCKDGPVFSFDQIQHLLKIKEV